MIITQDFLAWIWVDILENALVEFVPIFYFLYVSDFLISRR